jgi:two-component system CitB family sensor kinase
MKASLWRHMRRRLSTQVVIMTVAILVLTMTAGFFVVQWNLRRQIAGQYENQALSVAQTLAADPNVASQVVAGHPGGELQRLATQVRAETGALFVVITNEAGIRYTHTNPELIGKPINYPDPEPTQAEPYLTGHPYTGIEHGTLGPEAVGKVPLHENGKLVGEVSIGFPVGKISRQFDSALPSLAVYLLLVLAVGVLAALGLARRLKRQTFGLELGEIAAPARPAARLPRSCAAGHAAAGPGRGRGDGRSGRQRSASRARRPGAGGQPDADSAGRPPAARLGGDLPGPHRVREPQAPAGRGDGADRDAPGPVARVR